MKRIFRATAGLGVMAASAATLGLAAVPAHAAAAPYTDGNSLGAFTITDVNNAVVSGGSTQVPFKTLFSKFQANTASPSPYNGDGSDGAGTYYGFLSIEAPTAADPSLWPGNPIGLTQTQPDATKNLLVNGNNLGTKSLATLIAGIAGTPSQPNTYELRLTPSDDASGTSTKYFTAFILVDPTGKTFTVESTDSTATTTTINAAPTSPVTAATATSTVPVVLSGTTTSTSSVVNLFDGPTSLGTAPVVGGAYTKTVNVAVGSHPLQAVANGDGANNQASGAVTPYTVNAPVAAALPEAPYALLLPLIAGGAGAAFLLRRKARA